jgi:8-oxo-dGTP pyrophosphatase MutT (NUDIX family)
MLYFVPPDKFIPRFAVVSCFCEYEMKILLLKRSGSSPQPNMWGMVAGKVDQGETPLHAITRELFEETGITATEEQFLLIQQTFIRYPEYDYIYYIYKLVLDEEVPTH